MDGMDQPAVTDYRRIIDVVRSRGSVHYPKVEIPGEFTGWRRGVRRAARAGDVSIGVIRTNDFVLVENRDYQVSEDDDLATADVIDARLTGRVLSYDDALHRRRRARLRVVPGAADRDSQRAQLD